MKINHVEMYNGFTRLATRELNAIARMGFNNLMGVLPEPRVELLTRLIMVRATLSRRANVELTWPEVNGYHLEHTRELLQTARLVYDAAPDSEYQFKQEALSFITKVEDRKLRLIKTQATRDRITLALAAGEARRNGGAR